MDFLSEHYILFYYTFHLKNGDFREFLSCIVACCFIFQKQDLYFEIDSYKMGINFSYYKGSRKEENLIKYIFSNFDLDFHNNICVENMCRGLASRQDKFFHFRITKEDIPLYFSTARERISIKSYLEKTLQQYDANFRLGEYL